MEFEINKGYENLCMAIINVAIHDYKTCLTEKLDKYKTNALRNFFNSDYFEMINPTAFTGNQIINMCEKSVAN